MRRLGVVPLLLLAATSTWGAVSPPTPSSILSQCVQACDCYQGSRPRAANLVVKCRDLADLPPIFPEGTTSLEIRDARVPLLGKQLHQHSLHRLHDLDMAGNSIEEVAVDAFQDLPKLRFVNLADNAIAALSAAHFDQQSHLGLVDVSGNTGLDCFAFRREMAAKWPRACVQCDGDDKPCELTAGSATSTTSTTLAPDLSDDEVVPSNELPESDYDEMFNLPTATDEDDVEVVKLTRDWSYVTNEGLTLAPSLDVDGSTFVLIAIAGALGGALGACLVLVAVAVVRRLREERPNIAEREQLHSVPLFTGSSNSVYATTTTPIPARAPAGRTMI